MLTQPLSAWVKPAIWIVYIPPLPLRYSLENSFLRDPTETSNSPESKLQTSHMRLMPSSEGPAICTLARSALEGPEEGDPLSQYLLALKEQALNGHRGLSQRSDDGSSEDDVAEQEFGDATTRARYNPLATAPKSALTQSHEEVSAAWRTGRHFRPGPCASWLTQNPSHHKHHGWDGPPIHDLLPSSACRYPPQWTAAGLASCAAPQTSRSHGLTRTALPLWLSVHPLRSATTRTPPLLPPLPPPPILRCRRHLLLAFRRRR